MASDGRVEFDPKEIARAGFPTAFRGYEQESVRRYLVRLAAAIGQAQKQGSLDSIGPEGSAQIRVAELEHETAYMQSRIDELETFVAEQESGGTFARELDEGELIELLGQETARIVASARSAAADIVQRAEAEASTTRQQAELDAAAAVHEAETTLSSARDEAASTLTSARAEAESTLGSAHTEAESRLSSAHAEAESRLSTARAEADDVAHRAEVTARKLEAQVQSEVDRLRDEAHDEAEQIRSDAAVQADGDLASARKRAAQIVADAEMARDEILGDLVRRRRASQARLDQLADARARLADALATARDELDEVSADLRGAAPKQIDIDLNELEAGSEDDADEVAQLAVSLERSRAAVAEGAPASTTDPADGSGGSRGDGGSIGSRPPSRRSTSGDEYNESDGGGVESTGGGNGAGHNGTSVDHTNGLSNGFIDDSSVVLDVAELVTLERDDHVLTAEGPVVVDGADTDDLLQQLGITNPPVLGIDSGSLQRKATRGDLPRNTPYAGKLPSAFEGRDVALAKATPGFKRRLKRAVNDDQSHVLDRLRAGRGKIRAEELPPLDEQLEGYVRALRPVLLDVVTSGAELLDCLDIPTHAVENLCLQLGKHVVDCLRLPTIDVIDDDNDNDREAILDPVRAIYRDFRNSLLPDLIEDALHEAFALGLYHAVEPGAAIIWKPDPRLDPDPICEENSASPAVTKGSEFPSGHPRPLSMPGCRCLVVPA